MKEISGGKRRRGVQVFSLFAATLAAAAAPAEAQGDARIAALEAQVQALMAEVQALREFQAQQTAAPVAQADAAEPAPVRARPQAALPATVAAVEGGPVVARADTGAVVMQQPPTEGVSGHPFYPPSAEGRRTGILGTGGDRVRLTLSGHINRSINTVDDGVNTDSYFVDNENASSRFRILGETAAFEGWKAVSLFEFEFMSNRSLVVNQLNESGNEQISRRLLDVGISNNRYGSVFLGHGWMASDGTSELDISGVTTPAWPSIHFGYGGMLFTDDDGIVDTNPTADGVQGRTVFAAMDSLDGLSRRDRVRYNTPVIEGFQLSASLAADDSYDAALRWSGSTDWAQFLVGGSYWVDGDDNVARALGGSESEGWSASGTMRLQGDDAWYDGVSVVGAIAQREFDDLDNDPFYWYGKLAYARNIWDVGRTGFAVNYASYDEFAAVDEEGEMIGFGLSQNLDPLGTEIYANLNFLTLDSGAFDYNDMIVLQTGAMVRF